jgi:hypothetical protein
MIGLASGHRLLGEPLTPVSGATLIQHNGQWTCESEAAGNPAKSLDAISNQVFIALTSKRNLSAHRWPFISCCRLREALALWELSKDTAVST